MDKTLDQSEIDSIFAAARAEKSHGTTTVSAAAPAERYNFGHAGQITREQLHSISAVNDLFARNLTHSLGAWLRSSIDLTLVSAEQMTWLDFTSLLSEPMYICSANLDPLDTIAALQLDLTLAPAIVDLVLGGVGRAGQIREPTDIEHVVLLSVVDLLIRELNSAWQPLGLAFTLDKHERDAQIPALMPPAERVLCVSFEARMTEVQGSINLCLPSVVLNKLLRRPKDPRPRRSTESRARMQHLLRDAVFDASLQFPTMRLNARALADLIPGKLLYLPLARQSSAELHIAAQPLFQAMPVRMGENRGAQLSSFVSAFTSRETP